MPPSFPSLLSKSAVTQSESPLFTLLPGELRSRIFRLALTDSPDPQKQQYKARRTYNRPGHLGPVRAYLELLRTCRSVYQECWFVPFLKEQTFWLCRDWDMPPQHRDQNVLAKLFQVFPEVARHLGHEKVRIDGVTIFSRAQSLDEGELIHLVSKLNPRRLRLIIRHTDWRNWQHDHTLYLRGSWLKTLNETLSKSSSLRKVQVELESLSRKQEQVDAIADQMRRRWFFRGEEGLLYASSEIHCSTSYEWSGASTWFGSNTWSRERWIRDEVAPGRIDYYVTVITFQTEARIRQSGGRVDGEAKLRAASCSSQEKPFELRAPKHHKALACPRPSVRQKPRVRKPFVANDDLSFDPMDDVSFDPIDSVYMSSSGEASLRDSSEEESEEGLWD
ncbi:hypothetical protein BGZ61DRAFT_469291 [Ilyonectria robusta]|uniref:uncharacterized protein n=1 Tax=Ilyonectria robusta TaxID=1079257 RepID=UPI001E8E04CD|nr:uncharacterized protein BGZ61DRAFT_469291 [Ilyonectria robusta]KAH8650489.1 hypothetical protein BGZ61DRAFT_469291 [Ilyonectria robusta]